MSDVIDRIEVEDFEDALNAKYLSYALSTITSRSLPDVRDGLKPVHRRIIYSMFMLGIKANSPYKKSARIVGDTMGKYHPHGDSSIYEALVRMAQDFSSRYPTMDGQGNFGNIDGDNAAAMRYTETRMTEMAEMLINGIEEDAVDFRLNYDDSEKEPTVLPSSFPNILANGATGIAVGMATSIPPHNIEELLNAAQALIKSPDISTKALLEFVKGPDFPTGGEIVETKEAILNAYETGRGSVRTRATWSIEEGRHGTWQIVVTEIPYMVDKSRLVSSIDDLIDQKQLPLLDQIRDESSEQIRIVLLPKNRTVDPKMLMQSVFRASDLEKKFSFNMNVLNMGIKPEVMGLKQILQCWLDHQFQVLVRRSNFRTDKIKTRLDILNGYIKVYGNLDEVVRIIRDEEEPKAYLLQKFELNNEQAEAILNMRLRSLRRLDEASIHNEHGALSDELEKLEKMLSSDKTIWKQVSKDIDATKSKASKSIGLERRTKVGEPDQQEEAAADVFAEAIMREDLTIVLSTRGWIRAIKGHVSIEQIGKFKEDDDLAHLVHATSTDRVSLLARNGRVFSIKTSDIPRKGDGHLIRLLADIPADTEIFDMILANPDQKYFVASTGGYGFIVSGNEMIAQKKAGKPIMTLLDDWIWYYCQPVNGDHIAITGTSGKLLIFPMSELSEFGKGKGVVLQKYKDDTHRMVDVKQITRSEGLSYEGVSGTMIRHSGELSTWSKGRATQGSNPPKDFPKSLRFAG